MAFGGVETGSMEPDVLYDLSARRAAEAKGVQIRLYSVIYQALEEVKDAMAGMLAPEIKEEITKYLGVEPILINSALVSAQNRQRLYWTNIPGVCQPKDKEIELQDVIESGVVDRKKALCLARRYAGFAGSQSYLCRRYFGKSFGQAVFEGNIEQVKRMWKENPYFESNERNIRQMTVKECERLQTLPDDYTAVDGVPTQMRYEAIGNGWTVDVIAHILKGLKEA